MEYLDEYRDQRAVGRLVRAIHARATRPVTLMEVCGGQTHAVLRFGLDQLLPTTVELLHGPGCPVCVTPTEAIDRAIALSAKPEITLCTFADMLRVPGSAMDLYDARARGGDVRVVYSPLQAVAVARSHPERQVVFFAVGFETTAPANALAVLQAEAAGLGNFSLLVSHVLVPPAMESIVASEHNRVQAFLAAGHVCAVAGTRAYDALAERYGVPIVVTGFEPVDLLQGILRAVSLLVEGRAVVDNAYARAVRRDGNPAANAVVARVFEPTDQEWRGLGTIAQSGLRLVPAYRRYDAARRFSDLPIRPCLPAGPSRCIAGLVLRGDKKPPQCSAFATSCTPETPLGAPMVSAEGACAAYHRYRATTDTPGGAAP